MATYFISLEVEAAREAVVKAALRKAFGEDAEIARSKSLPATLRSKLVVVERSPSLDRFQ